MECVKKLKAALAAVPVSQPCTAATVTALSVGAHDAAQQLVPLLSSAPLNYLLDSAVAEACSWQQLPAACMPVLAWLAAGLRSGLPAAAQRQAQEVACVLLGVLSLVVPGSLGGRLYQDPGTAARQSAEAAGLRLLQTLGAFGEISTQLAAVASALVATVFHKVAATTTTTSGSSSNSNRPPEVQQVAFMAMAWQCMAQLWKTVLLVHGQAAEPAVAAALTGSGLYQVLLEGALLLLSLDPAAYSQAVDVQVELSSSLGVAVRAAITLVQTLGLLILSAWSAAHAEGMGASLHVLPHQSSSSGSSSRRLKPWMPPLFKLQVLLLAKMQWDVRHGPARASHPQDTAAWPAKPLARALRHMVSPCVAGDLLQQCAPGLVPHGYKTQTFVKQQGQVLNHGVAEQPYDVIGACDLSTYLVGVCHPMRACLQDGMPFEAIGALDLALLLEVTELYCLVCPPGPAKSVCKDAFMPLQQALVATPRSVMAQFTATYGGALLSIAEYLVEDVLLESSGAAGAASGSAAGPQAAGQGAAAGRSQHGIPETQASSSSSKHHPRAGGRSPAVTAQHRVMWTQDAASTLGVLTLQQDKPWSLSKQTDSSRDPGGNIAGLMKSLFTTTNAPRVSRLLEVALRTPELQGGRLHYQMTLLPFRLPLLHVAASSPEGSRALLSAVTSAAKAQQAGLVVISALVQTQGQVAPAAAGVVAAVPGRMGQAVAAQVLQQPAIKAHVALEGGLKLAYLVSDLMARAAALLDPVLAPLAAYLAATQLPPGQDSKPWAVEAALSSTNWLSGASAFKYHGQLVRDPQHMSGIMRDLTAALSLRQAAAVSKQAAKLVKKAGGGAEQAEQLRQQLQGMWLGRDEEGPARPSATEQQPVAADRVICTSRTLAGTASTSRTVGRTSDASQLPGILLWVCRGGLLNLNEVLAAGDPAAWSAALGPTSDADLRVASTALLAACKAAGAVAQLPVLIEQLQPIMAQQPWGRDMAKNVQRTQTNNAWAAAADWALLLAPLLAVLLPAQQAAELQETAAEVQRDDLTRGAVLTPATISQVLGLLGHVAAPGAPGCSYPGCCNLEGRSEAELRVLVCSKCKGARYCCREHQLAHWKAGHKEVCRAAQAAVEQVRQATAPAGS